MSDLLHLAFCDTLLIRGIPPWGSPFLVYHRSTSQTTSDARCRLISGRLSEMSTWQCQCQWDPYWQTSECLLHTLHLPLATSAELLKMASQEKAALGETQSHSLCKAVDCFWSILRNFPATGISFRLWSNKNPFWSKWSFHYSIYGQSPPMTWPWQPEIPLRAIRDLSADRLVLDEDARDIARYKGYIGRT